MFFTSNILSTVESVHDRTRVISENLSTTELISHDDDIRVENNMSKPIDIEE